MHASLRGTDRDLLGSLRLAKAMTRMPLRANARCVSSYLHRARLAVNAREMMKHSHCPHQDGCLCNRVPSISGLPLART